MLRKFGSGVCYWVYVVLKGLIYSKIKQPAVSQRLAVSNLKNLIL